MDIEKLDINAVCFGILCNFTPVCGEEKAKEAVALIRSLQTENEKLQAEVERQRRSADNGRHLYENAERAYMKVLAELERVTAERDAAQRLLAEHTGVVGMEKVTTCAEKKAWLRRYQGSLRQEKELAEEVEQLEVEI